MVIETANTYGNCAYIKLHEYCISNDFLSVSTKFRNARETEPRTSKLNSKMTKKLKQKQ